MTRWIAAFALVLLTACASGGAPPTTDTGKPTKDDALAALVPPQVARSGKLRVGSNVQNPPNNFYAEDGKTPIGSEVDLITAVAAKLGLAAEHQDMAFSSLITSLQAGRIDVTMAAMNDTAERQQKIDFVDYFTSGITIMVRKGNPDGIKAPRDLCGKAVAVNLGSSQEQYAKTFPCSTGSIEVTATDSDTQNQNQLRTGRVAAILNDLPTAVYVAKTAGDGKFFEVVDAAPINGGPYGIGVNKSTPELATAIQKALQALIDDGTYGKIMDKWGVTQGAIAKATVNGR